MIIRYRILFILIAFLLCWVYFALPLLGLYANDGGAKYIQMKGFYLVHWQKLSIDYPGTKLGLDYSYLSPLRLFRIVNNKYYCSYDPFFTFLSSLLYPFFGDRVIHFWPLLSFFLALVFLAKTLDMFMKRGLFHCLLLLIFFIGSPVVLYSITFWEHLPAVFLVVLSFYYLASYFKKGAHPAKLFASALALGMGIFLRTEHFFIIPSYLLSSVWSLYRRNEKAGIIPLLVGMALPFTAYGLFNLIAYGSLRGLHASYHLPYNFYWHNGFWYTGLILVASLVLIFVAKNRDKETLRKFYSLIIIFWLVGLFYKFSLSPLPGFFGLFPVFFVVFFDAPKTIENALNAKPGAEEIAFLTLCLYVSFIGIFLYNNPDLSERYVLEVVPLAVLCLGMQSGQITRFKPLVVGILILAACGVFFNLREVKNRILRFKYYNAERIEFLGKYTHKGDVVVFDANPLMEHCGPLFFERVYVVRNNKDTPIDVLDSLKEKGIKDCYYWTMDSGFSKTLQETGNYKVKEYEFSSKRGPRHYLIAVEQLAAFKNKQ